MTVPVAVMVSSLALVTGVRAQTPKPRPPAPAPAKPAAKPAAPPPRTAAPSPAAVCEYITPEEAKGLLGVDATASAAPSKGLFTSCGYTSPTGDAITISIADYGLPSVAQQFFDKTREVLKTTTSENTLGVPAFSYAITGAAPPAAPPVASRGAPPPATTAARPVATAPPRPVTPPAPAGATTVPPLPNAATATGTALLALKDQRTVRLEAVGPMAGRTDQLPKLRAILTRVLTTLAPPPMPPAADTPPR